MTGLLAAAGIDPVQWRSLTVAYLRMDLRRGGGALRKDSQKSASALSLAGLLVGAAINSVVIALLVFLIRDPLTAAVGMVTMATMTISMLLLLDFTGSVISAEDYWVIAPRPVTSRTYFAARLSAVLVYVIGFSLVLSFMPGLVFLAWHRLGVGAFAGALAATVLSAVAGSAVVIAAYTYLIARIAPSRLVRVMSGVHLFASVLSMAGFLVVMKGFENATVREYSLGDLAWIWYVPVTWFAAIVPVLGGTGSGREMLAAAGATLLTPILLSLACGRITLEFASHLSEATSSGPARSRRTIERIPGFSRGEAYAVATLVRAQFRNDLRFRLGILGILPMTAFYLFLGWDEGLWTDPFAVRAKGGGAPVYMALAFLPMILHSALQVSDHWRASWIFLATPADPARLLVATKNFVAIFVLGSYLLLMAGFWTMFYERVWHALVHALFVGAGAHMLLQASVILSPGLPFAKEPKRTEQSGRLFFLLFVGMLFTSLGPALLPFVYSSAARTIALAAVLAAVTAVLERTLHRRARAFTAELEMA
ncbi:MAG TPA: hypothetical protein VJ813_18835 [Vicinamibacterales bacterium]|nr:hypothetical protein [Vicinamibacterales bacterium]